MGTILVVQVIILRGKRRAPRLTTYSEQEFVVSAQVGVQLHLDSHHGDHPQCFDLADDV